MLARWTWAVAWLAGLVVLTVVIVAGTATPGYSQAAQFISEFGARGAPYADQVNWFGFLPAGILVCAFAALAWLTLPRSAGTTFGLVGIALFGFGYVIAVFYPCDPGCRPAQASVSQTIHNVLGLAGYVTAAPCLVLLGWQARTWPQGANLARLAFVCAAAALVGFVLLLEPSPYAGAAQRLLEASVLLWVVACGTYVRRRSVSNV